MFSSFQCIVWLALALIAEIPIVVCPFPPFKLDDLRLIVSQAFEVLNWNGMIPSPSPRVWTEADSSLCYLTDAWNDVRFIIPLSLLVGS